jgi:hypothetical protein
MWQGVNEVPSLVAFKRQATLRTGKQHRDPNPLTTTWIKVNTLCCIAKAEESPPLIELWQAGAAPRDQKCFIAEAGSGPDFRHVTTLRVNHLFTRPNGPQSPLKGTLGTRRLLIRMARFSPYR